MKFFEELISLEMDKTSVSCLFDKILLIFERTWPTKFLKI